MEKNRCREVVVRVDELIKLEAALSCIRQSTNSMSEEAIFPLWSALVRAVPGSVLSPQCERQGHTAARPQRWEHLSRSK